MFFFQKENLINFRKLFNDVPDSLQEIEEMISDENENFVKKLFIFFFFTNCSNSIFQMFLQTEELLEESCLSHFESSKFSFFFRLMMTKYRFSQKDNSFIKKLSFQLQWKGLSATGLNLLQKFDVTISLKTLKRYEELQLLSFEKKLTSCLEEKKKGKIFLSFKRVFCFVV
jgi:hypothetical protein